MVLHQAKHYGRRLSGLATKKYLSLDAVDVAEARLYIKRFWPKLTRSNPKDEDTLIGLPKPYLVPAFEAHHEFDFNELYYWDSYFMVQGMLDEDHRELVMGTLDDLVYLFKRFGVIPNASRTYMTSRSQPPVLTSFILDVYDAYQPGEKWLANMMAVAQEEYETVWLGNTKPHARQVYDGLSRYYDFNYLHEIAETESGWDMTPRFRRRCLDYLPIDLNCLLYKYEIDFAEAAERTGDKPAARKWRQAAARRQKAVNRLMWNELRGLYYDYNFARKMRGSVSSLAAYYALWTGLASPQQAKRLVASLKKFERPGGLATTDRKHVGSIVPGALPTQWAYPNGWAPLHYIVVQGLRRYGYHDEARRIAMKWLKTNLDWFKAHGVFLEKYNVVQPSKPPAAGVYPSQTGFGWTNAIFEYFCQEYIDK